MKIAIDIRSLQNNQLTGVGLYLKKVLENLLSLDQNNQYLLFYSGFLPLNQPALNSLSRFKNIEYFKINWPNKLLNFCLTFLSWPHFDNLMKADYFWFPNLTFYSFKKTTPVVLTIHDLSFLKYPDFYSHRRKFWHWAVKPLSKLKQAVKIIAVSQNTKQDLIELIGLTENKIEVIYPGVDLNLPKNTENIQTKYNLPPKFILFLGTLEPRKNLASVISAFEKIKDPELHLIIAGGQGWLYKNLYQQAKQSAKKTLIKFINYIEPEEINALYLLAAMLVWPSYYEGFGFPPLEALTVRTSAIAGANSAMGEVLKDSALLVDPYNINETAEAIHQLFNDKNLKTNFLLKAEKNLKNYSWPKTAENLLKLFNQLT